MALRASAVSNDAPIVSMFCHQKVRDRYIGRPGIYNIVSNEEIFRAAREVVNAVGSDCRVVLEGDSLKVQIDVTGSEWEDGTLCHTRGEDAMWLSDYHIAALIEDGLNRRRHA